MNAMPKKKLCWNCEGSVSLADESCPYCGVSVQSAGLDGTENSFLPPYRMSSHGDNQSIPAAPYSAFQNPQADDEKKEEQSTAVEDSNSSSEFKQVLIPMILLFSGSLAFLFGLVLFLFSQNGIFTLSWNGTLWYVYSLLSIPLLILGWLTLQKLNDT